MSQRLRLLPLVAAVLAVGVVGSTVWFTAANPTMQQASSGRALYLDHCARCHGKDLEGQPDWKRRNESGRLPAPPHDESGHTWHHSDSQLLTITKFGLAAIAPGYESDMPAFADVLSDDEIRSILDYIKTTWPERPRAYQAERSRADS